MPSRDHDVFCVCYNESCCPWLTDRYCECQCNCELFDRVRQDERDKMELKFEDQKFLINKIISLHDEIDALTAWLDDLRRQEVAQMRERLGGYE